MMFRGSASTPRMFFNHNCMDSFVTAIANLQYVESQRDENSELRDHGNPCCPRGWKQLTDSEAIRLAGHRIGGGWGTQRQVFDQPPTHVSNRKDATDETRKEHG